MPNSLYNPFSNKEFKSKYGIEICSYSSICFLLSNMVLIISFSFLGLSILIKNPENFWNYSFIFTGLIFTSYFLNIFAKKEMMKFISKEQLNFLINNQKEFGIEKIEKTMTKKEFIIYIDIFFENDKDNNGKNLNFI